MSRKWKDLQEEGTGTTGGVIGTNQDVDVKERGNGLCNDVGVHCKMKFGDFFLFSCHATGMTCRKKELEPGTTGGVIGTNQDVDVKERGNGFCNDAWGTRESRSAIINARIINFSA
ncbi:hypothetical protein CEXT_477731 [Caerostris extrusa]|uniref:Uncharacterized protein n=1 Tax=Caerostris extrusa TaxID=172846 RepID=A0AAV4NXU8_CAEEX|nr:hypothetical protein CEXT_477731 [Caerostris extrusa]